MRIIFENIKAFLFYLKITGSEYFQDKFWGGQI